MGYMHYWDRFLPSSVHKWPHITPSSRACCVSERPSVATSRCRAGLTTSLVAYDTNRYSVDSAAVGRTVMLRAHADRIVVIEAGTVIGEHPRLFGRHQVPYDLWHYVTVLQRKPGALRNGAPFRY